MRAETDAAAQLRVPDSTARFAYAFYATDDLYALAAATAVRALREAGTHPEADFVVLHHGVAEVILRNLRDNGVRTVEVSPVPFAAPGYFEHSLTKLRVLQLLQFERVVFLDADTLPLCPVDDLFTSDWNGPIAAPLAYWLPERLATTALFAFKPAPSLFARVAEHFAAAGPERLFDMDIVNRAFAADLHWLPAEYLCLNSEYGDRNRPTYFGDPSDSYGRVRVVHFSDLGKPWSYTPGTVRQMRPDAHSEYHRVWQSWWDLRAEVIAAGAPADQPELRWRAYRAILKRKPARP